MKYKYAILSLFLISFPLLVFAQANSKAGWRFHTAAVPQTFSFDQNDDDNRNPPNGFGGGANVGMAYHFAGRWETRFYLISSVTQVKKQTAASAQQSPDFHLGAAFEPILHFRRNPTNWDPYVIIPEIGFLHLFRNGESGVTIGFPGFGLEYKINDRASLYIEGKVRWGLMSIGDDKGFAVGGEFPMGLLYRF